MKRPIRATMNERGESDSRRERNGATEARSRREFMRLMAVGAGAMLAAPAAAAVKAPVKKTAATADTTHMKRARTEPGAHPMLPEELEKQKKYTADTVKKIRDYSLPPGSAPAFVFRPLAQKSRKERRP